MSTVGLTKAQREWIETLRARAIERGWVAVDPNDKGRRFITPRGHAALAAPSMTQAELDTLLLAEEFDHARDVIVWDAGAVARRCQRKGWVANREGLTPAGRTALNNVRAATGSPDYKEEL